LSRTAVWREFSQTLAQRLEAGSRLEIRSTDAGPVVWAYIPKSKGWISRQIDLPRLELRGALLFVALGLLLVVLVGAALLARQLTGPLRRLATLADRFAAGEPPSPEPVGGPLEIRHVQSAFVRLSGSLQAAEQEREAMLAGVSHDLRTPLSRMRFALGLHGEGANPRLIEELERDLDELDELVGQFVAYARSNYEETRTQVDLDALVASVINAHEATASIEWRGASSRTVSLEAGNVRRLVKNLVDNAIRHGKPPVQVSTSQTEWDVTLIVRDSGSGISPADQQAALEPFTQLGAEDAPGSGLGLAIVSRIARRHCGEVSMRQNPDGFEVRVTLVTGLPKDHMA
jgi:two-component system, OmpR family, osmolarity sensor histidine kinase EnvZ